MPTQRFLEVPRCCSASGKAPAGRAARGAAESGAQEAVGKERDGSCVRNTWCPTRCWDGDGRHCTNNGNCHSLWQHSRPLSCQVLPVPRAPHVRALGERHLLQLLGEKNTKIIKDNCCLILKIELGRLTSRDKEGVTLLHPKGPAVLLLLSNFSVSQPRCFNELIRSFSTQS